MIISDAARLILYMLMGIFPIWSDFLAKSSDYSARGLAMPILASLSTAVAIALAKTSTKKDSAEEPIKVETVNTTTNPVITKEAPKKK